MASWISTYEPDVEQCSKRMKEDEDQVCYPVQSRDLKNASHETITPNKEVITLIWMDETIDDLYKEDSRLTKQMLREINDYVLFYSDLSLCISYIQSIKNNKIFLIIPGSLSRKLFSEIHSLRQIDSIFIFCVNQQVYQTLTSEYSKVIGIFSEQNSLMICIKENIKLVEKQSEIFNLYNQKQKSTRDLTTESGSFLYVQLFKNVLLKTPQTIDTKKQMLDECRLYYRGNKKELSNIEEFRSSYTAKDAIKWYTKQTFVYKLLNKAFRTEDFEAVYSFRFYIFDLCASIVKKHKELKTRQKSTLKLYRGLKMSVDEIQKLKDNIGSLIATNGFLSTSRSFNVAKMYTSNVMFEILADTGLKTVACADIAEISTFSNEEEILFDLGATFIVESVGYDKGEKLWSVKMTATDKGAEIAKEYIEHQRKELSKTDVSDAFGSFLSDMGEYTKSEKYFKNLLQIHPNDEHTAILYSNIGRALGQKGDYTEALRRYTYAHDIEMNVSRPRLKHIAGSLLGIATIHNWTGKNDLALEFYNKALDTYKKVPKVDQQDIAYTINNIGIVYYDKGDYDQSLEYSLKALKMRETFLPDDHPDIALSLNNISNAYIEKGNYDLALEYYKKALRINEKLLPSNHPEIGATLNNIGNVYHKECDYHRALEYHTKALIIREKSLPTDHFDIADSFYNIGMIFHEKHDYGLALAYYTKALRIYERILPADHPHIMGSLRNIGIVHSRDGNSDLAQDFYTKALKIGEKILPSNHLDLIHIQNLITNK